MLDVLATALHRKRHHPAVAAAQAGPVVSDAELNCVEVEVDGVRAPLSYARLTQKLSPASESGGAPPPQDMTSESIVQGPSNQLGPLNRAATSNRIGNTIGTSVYLQRLPSHPSLGSLIPQLR